MTSLSELKRVWQESSAESVIDGIGKQEVRVLLQDRSARLKKQILKRLSTEILTYFLLALSLLFISFFEGFTARKILLASIAILAVVPSIAVLAYKEYRLRTSPMSGTLRDSIAILIKAIDSTAGLYLYVYVASVVLSLALIAMLLISSNGWSLLTVIFVLAAFVFAVWSYLSGRRYASGMFRRHRSELVSLLRELESL